VLQPTSYCNLNCRYCYLPNRQDTSKMSLAVLRSVLKKVLESRLTDERLMLLWHAGEPLVAGLPFYREAVAFTDSYRGGRVRVEHAIQTNGTLLTDEWCDFFKKNEFHVGVSLDGPRFLHDAERHNWSGRGSFEAVMSGIHRLQDHGVEFGILGVLTQRSLPYATELYDFYKSLHPASVGFNIEEAENAHTCSDFSATEFTSVRRAYRAFIDKMIQRVLLDPEPLVIREIDRSLKAVMRLRQDRTYVYEPLEAATFRMITVLLDGSVSPYSPELAGSINNQYHNFKIGNLVDDSLESIHEMLLRSDLCRDVNESRQRCQHSCSYFQLCGGAYFSNKLSENGSLLSTETLSCRLHSQVILDAFADSMATPT
jgi:uncharacterized protein